MKSKKLSFVPAPFDNEDDEGLQDLVHSNDEDDDDDFADISDDDVGRLKTIDRSHDQLLSQVKQATSVKKSKRVAVRHESVFLKKGPSTLAPLLSLTSESKKGKDGKLSLRDLASSVLKTTADTARPAVKELTKLAKKKSLNVPLNKPAADQASRIANYEDVKARTSRKWGDIIRTHQTADHLSFPLPVIQSLDDESRVVPKKSTMNEMEQKIESLLSSSENRLEDTKELTVAEEKLLQSLSVEEAQERLHELQRTRALLSYQEAKMKREAKIKSKSFHRIRKREKLRDALKDFEALKQSDPKAALEQLQEFDKSRALERASLRHRNTGKFAKQAKIRAKYDDGARSALEEQMQIHQKNLKRREYSSDEEQADDVGEADEENGEEGNKGDNDDNNADQPEDDEPFDVAATYNPWLKPTTKESLETETEKDDVTAAAKEVKQVKLRKSFLRNPNDDVIDADAPDDDEDRLALRQRNQRDVINEAFADDDVIQEFVKEREEESKGKDEEDQEMPGWGSWAGVDADVLNKQENRKRKFQRQKELKETMNKKMKRMDASSYDAKVIIKGDTGASEHRVKQIPFPFKSVPEFEAGILANPIGRTFVPETAFRVLTREKVSTKMGTIITPMCEDNIRKRRKGKGDKKKKKEKKK